MTHAANAIDTVLTGNKLPIHGALSFSAGGTIEDIDKWRLVAAGGRSVRDLARLFPDLEERGFLEDPIVISVYPATLELFDDAMTIDTYLRPANLSRALHLARSEARPVILLGQPLPTAELLLQHMRANLLMPSRMLMLIGGYECPAGLEAHLAATLAGAGVEHEIVHGYGTAEVAAGCLMGRRSAKTGLIHYRLATSSVIVEVRAGHLWLQRREVGEAVDTGDLAGTDIVDEQPIWRIQPADARVARRVRQLLDSWTADDWDRYTGYLDFNGPKVRIQLRRGMTPTCPEEVTFGRFEDEYGSSLLDKPRWG